MGAGTLFSQQDGWDLFFDDLRVPQQDDWVVCRSVAEAQRVILRDGPPRYASLDHDMGVVYCRACAFRDAEEPCLSDDGDPTCGCSCHVMQPTGMDLLRWMAETGNWPRFRPRVHSANPVAAERMRQFIDDSRHYET